MRSFWFAALVCFCVAASGFILVRARLGGDAGQLAAHLTEGASQAVEAAAARLGGEPEAAAEEPPAEAPEFYRYTDESGTVRFVSSLEDVPRALRDGARPVGNRVVRAPATRTPERIREQAFQQGYETALAHRVVVYTTSWCGWCRKTLAFLDQRGVTYENRNIEEDEMWREELIEKTGGTSIPVVEIDGEIVRGYDPQRMAALLRSS
jgi:glutaredoxin-like YruB-family protein